MTNAEKLTLAKHACHIRMGVIEIPGSFGFRDFFVLRCSLSASSPSPSPTVTDSPFCHLR